MHPQEALCALELRCFAVVPVSPRSESAKPSPNGPATYAVDPPGEGGAHDVLVPNERVESRLGLPRLPPIPRTKQRLRHRCRSRRVTQQPHPPKATHPRTSTVDVLC